MLKFDNLFVLIVSIIGALVFTLLSYIRYCESEPGFDRVINFIALLFSPFTFTLFRMLAKWVVSNY